MTSKKRCRDLPTTPFERIDGKAGSSSVNPVGLESQLSDKVKLTRSVTLHSDQTESGRIKVDSVGASAGGSYGKNEIRMIQDIDRRRLQFKPDSFRDPNAFDEAHIQLKVFRAA